MTTNVEMIGYMAATCTTAAFVPQVYKAWKEKTTSGVSLTMYLIFFTGILLWLYYGLHQKDYPLIIANAITAVLAFFMLLLKIRYR